MRERLEDFFWRIEDWFYDLKEKVSSEEAEEDEFFEEDDGERVRKADFSGWKRAGGSVLHFMRRFWIPIMSVVLLASAVVGFIVYNRTVTFEGYAVAASFENLVSTGTGYRAIDKDIMKYNSDGVTCVSRNNDVRWSITYSMQSPVVDVCDTTMVIAEQHGNQIYVVNEEGLVGNFETDLPILKACVSRQGVTAAMLQEEEVTWVNLYRPDGTLIASDKTTIAESGHPLAFDISPDGQHMAVSYMGVESGVLTDTMAFYNFGTAGQELENNLASTESFKGTAIPVVYYADNSRVVAVRDDGFTVFEGTEKVKESASADFKAEIISCFHEDQSIGFVFNNEGTAGGRYRIELYGLNGKQKMSLETDYSYKGIRMQNGQILLYNDNSCTAYTASGHLWFHSNYEKEVLDFYYFSEYRKYLVITRNSFDRIRIGQREENEG